MTGIPTAATMFAAPFSEKFINEYRESAKDLPYPRSVFNPLMADVMEADRIAHQAIVNGDKSELDKQIMRRCSLMAALDKAKQVVADEWLSGVSHAMERQPDSVLRILDVNKIAADRLDAIEEKIQQQEQQIRALEAAMSEVAGALV